MGDLVDAILSDALRQHLEAEEGVKQTAYLDTEGVLTIGIGHNLNVPIPKSAIDAIYHTDIDEAYRTATLAFNNIWPNINLARRVAIVSMCFQLGQLRFAGFAQMIRAIREGDWDNAAKEALNSKWAEQVPSRARRIAHMLLTGSLTT